uniref:NADH dehydrogenase subunit 2 n=1 Tax=Turanoclytus namaganensis TaxID=2874582 RepID=UPI001EDE10F8|nr:NADH dehydrogenase subunit 2 [Turanoclytus namaganensis]UHY95165.1 NADH dehydrogenase subunit 2 [Turanoclytus namaganensis]
MLNFYKILFFCTLLVGTLITISSYSWFSMWLGLEINLLSMIPLMSNSKNLYPSESALKYFITQALASSIVLFSIIVMMNLKESAPQDSENLLMMILNSALLTKVGAAPFHSWFPEVMEGLDWVNCLILLTWQKIAPMIMIMYNMNMTAFFSSIIIFSSLISGILGLNQISLRKIMAYSSINHIGWMIAAMHSQSIWIVYFIVYTIISINIVTIFQQNKIFSIKQLNSILNQSKPLKILFIVNFLSLGGIPPFLGFIPKWLTINSLVNMNFYLISFILIIFTLVTLYFYLRITFSTLTILSTETIINKIPVKNFLPFSVNFLTLSGLALCTLIFNYF